MDGLQASENALNWELFKWLNIGWMALAVLVFLLLQRVRAPYGRHASDSWGPMVSNHIGWIIMELPSMIVVAIYAIPLMGDSPGMWLLPAGLFIGHYLYRSLVFPFRIKTLGKKMPLIIMLSAIGFNLVNGFLLGYGFGHFYSEQTWDPSRPKMWFGLVLFFSGLYLNIKHDNILIALRRPGDTAYRIPEGGLFRWVSCPNHFGEMVEWCGFALLCWSLPALSFLVWTVANLLPRALAHHAWYQDHFPDYPKNRKAVIPFIL